MTIPASITPTKLRIILMATLALILLGGAGLFYFAYTRLNTSATDTGNQVAQARESEDTLQRLKAVKQELEEERDTVLMTSRVMADSQNYAYQDRLVNDLTTYASRAGLTVTNISFVNQSSGPAAPAAESPTPTDGALPAEDGAAAVPAAAGPRTATVDITLESPTNYVGLLNFLHYVEQNLTKMKVSRVTMNRAEGGVSVDALNLEVYLR